MAKIKEWLTRDFQINIPWKACLPALLFVLLPNVFFWLAAFWGHAARPLINWDYLWVSALMVVPFRPAKFLAALLFVGCMLFDVLMLAMQWFPFMDLAAVRYLAPFITIAPMRYMVMAGIVAVYALLMPIVLAVLARKVRKSAVWLVCAALAVMSYFVGDMMYHEAPPERFGRDDYYISAGQFDAYRKETGNTFAEWANSMPKVEPYPKENAVQHLLKPFSKKLLLVVNESWGVARKPEVQRAMLQGLYDLPDKDFIEDGYFDFAGATVQAELRELCHWQVENGYSFKSLPDKPFVECLPNILKKQGYQTYAMHGSGSVMYDRFDWYARAGFQHTIFSENLPNGKRCHPFNGVCDSDLYQQVSKAFAAAGDRPILFYWMTLTSHAPYEVEDITDKRLDCKKYQLAEGDICNNMMLQTQFFDGLAALLRQPEMRGTEVLVVGDHMPPILNTDVPIHPYLHWNDVSWVHLKLKD